MSRPSGFTDAELAAAAWKRNMQLQATLKEAQRTRSILGGTIRKAGEDRQSASKKKKRDGGLSSRKKEKKTRKKSSSASNGGKRERKTRSESLGSVDSLGRQRKRERSRSPSSTRSSGGSSSRSYGRRRSARKLKRAREGARSDEEMSDCGTGALGWRGMMARRGTSVSSPRSRGWSSAGSLGSVCSDRETDGESADEADGDVSKMRWEKSIETEGKLAMLDPTDQVPPDPKRPDHDDRVQRWRCGWQSGVSTGTMGVGKNAGGDRLGGRGSRGFGIGSGRSASESGDSDDRRGRHRRRRSTRLSGGGSSEVFDEAGRRGRSSRSRKHRSRSPGDGSSARSLSRSISRDRRSRRSSRSRSPSFKRSRSRERYRAAAGDSSVYSLIRQYSRRTTSPERSATTAKGASSANGRGGGSGVYGPADKAGPNADRRADLIPAWTHDLFDEVAGDSPRRVNLPPGYKPEQPTWVSRAGGVYLPLKPT